MAFIPKNHCLPFLVWCISGSRCCSRFLVDVARAGWLRPDRTAAPIDLNNYVRNHELDGVGVRRKDRYYDGRNHARRNSHDGHPAPS